MTQRFVPISQLIKEIQERLNPLRLSLTAMQEERHAYLIDQFNKAGGCKVCGGRGWIVKWDTMDYMDGSCAEYGACTNPQCTEASRKRTGCFPKESKYDKFRKGYTDPMLDPAWQRIIEPITKQINDLDSAMKSAEQLQRTPFKYGDHVRQVRGRKLPIGTEGYVSFIHPNGGILLKTRENYPIRMSPAIGWTNSNGLDRLVAV